VGYPEHPRAGGTDDLETLFSIAHRRLVRDIVPILDEKNPHYAGLGCIIEVHTN
jgi:hypothetical protein